MLMGADGPEPTVARRINGERVVLLGWSRAILMQLAHPLIAAGVGEHSSFKGTAAQAAVRAHQTVGAMLSLTFGNDERRENTLEHIRGIHRMVNGTLSETVGRFPAGTRYSAEDPELLLWVHATLLDSTVDVYQRLVAPISSADLDTYCQESLPTLLELGGDPATALNTWADVRAYMTQMEKSGVLAVSARTRALADSVIWPRGIWPLVVGPLNREITVGLLSPALRAVYGYSWDAARETRFRRLLGLIRAVRRVTPRTVAEFRDARKVR
jgi:uncharacterized protein (DUF2236 family)